MDILQPFKPAAIPEPQTFEAPQPKESPFAEPLDEEMLIQNLALDRPLKLVIPDFLDQVNFSYFVANGTPGAMRRAMSKGWRPVDNPHAQEMYAHLHGGVDKHNKEYKPVLMARPIKVSQIARQRSRQAYVQQQSDLHPRNKVLETSYAAVEKDTNVTKYQRSGFGAPAGLSNFAGAQGAGEDVHRAGPINPPRSHMVWNPETSRFEAGSAPGITTSIASQSKKAV